ncbi:MAG: porin family protein [Pseudomonadota bacterium]
MFWTQRTPAAVCLFIVTALALPSVATAQSDATFDVAVSVNDEEFLRLVESQIAAGNIEGAYTSLSMVESRLAGNVYYDYLLGVAALDSGRTSEAIFALRRAIAIEPGFSGARMELARAYYEAGNPELARPLFVALLDERPPPGVRDVLDSYIAAIDARPVAPASRFSPFVDFGVGFDTNANGSTDSNQFLGFMLSPDNVETDSPFAELGVGFNYSAPQSTQFVWYLGGRAGHRHNSDASFVDSSVVSGLGGFSWQRGSFFGRLGADAYWMARDGSSNSSYGGMDLMLGARTAARWDLTFSARGGALRYDSAIDTLDVDRLLYSLGARYRFSSGLGSMGIELVGGDDDAVQVGSPHGNSKTGARFLLNAPLGDAHFFMSVGSLESDYDGLFFGVPREDDQLSATVQVEFRDVWTDGLSLIPRIRYFDNDSNIDLYRYDRTEAALLLRWAPR